MTGRDAAKVIVVVVLFLTVQQTLMLDIHISGIHPDIMVVLPIAAGIIGGPSRGAIMGFGAGLVADLFLPTTFGLSALIGCLVGFGVGMATVALDRSAWWLPPLAALGASAVYEVAYAAVGSILGQPQMLHVNIVGIVLVVSIVNALVAVPAVRLVGWALPKVSTEGMPGSIGPVGTTR
jgi:rod shape-determining protein MreD